jgi:hypothetical protein
MLYLLKNILNLSSLINGGINSSRRWFPEDEQSGCRHEICISKSNWRQLGAERPSIIVLQKQAGVNNRKYRACSILAPHQ